MLEEYIKDNYYARFDTRSYHCFREINLNARLNINIDRWMDRQKDGRKFELLCRTLLQAGATKMIVIKPWSECDIAMFASIWRRNCICGKGQF